MQEMRAHEGRFHSAGTLAIMLHNITLLLLWRVLLLLLWRVLLLLLWRVLLLLLLQLWRIRTCNISHIFFYFCKRFIAIASYLTSNDMCHAIINLVESMAAVAAAVALVVDL